MIFPPERRENSSFGAKQLAPATGIIQKLLEFAGQSLADYKTPERILLFPELPKNANGKVDRPALKDLAATLLEGSELEDV